MTATSSTIEQAPTDRLRRVSPLRRLLGRPELGAAAGSILVWVFFAIVAGRQGFVSLAGTVTYLEVASTLGILAIAVSMLMIGGEFDLSVGSTIGACGMVLTILTVVYGLNIWLAIGIAIIFSLLIGFFNGYLVIQTGLPSFIVTLGSLFIIRGATIGLTRMITGRTQLGGLQDVSGYASAEAIFATDIVIGGSRYPVSILWWLALAALATWVLLRTRFGNWIFGVGGDANASRNVGVPVNHVKISLFMTTALAACMVAIIEAVTFTGADVLRGQNREFFAIIATVIGGTLLTGGYGSAIGAVFGSLLFGMVRQGIVFAGVDADWFQVFLGAMVLIAVVVNNYVRKRAMRSR